MSKCHFISPNKASHFPCHVSQTHPTFLKSFCTYVPSLRAALHFIRKLIQLWSWENSFHLLKNFYIFVTNNLCNLNNLSTSLDFRSKSKQQQRIWSSFPKTQLSDLLRHFLYSVCATSEGINDDENPLLYYSHWISGLTHF